MSLQSMVKRALSALVPCRVCRTAPGLGLGAVSVLLAGCDSPLTQNLPDPGFVAVVTNVEAADGVSPGADWSLSLRELSGTFPVDQSETIQPGDTVIFTVPPASYDLRLGNLPVACGNRFGLARRAVLYEPGQTSIVRFNIQCAPLMTLVTSTDGPQADDEYVYRLVDEAGAEIRAAVVAASDTVAVDGIAPGRYRVELAHVAPNCVVISDGGSRVSVTAVAPIHPVALFRVRCSDPAFRPTIDRVEASLTEDGSAALFVSARDPGSAIAGFPDLDRFYWDVTDCRGLSLLEGGAREFRGLRVPGGRLVGQETVRFMFVLPGEVPPPPVAGERCLAVRLQDFEGNSTRVVSDLLDPVAGSPPGVDRFDVALIDRGGDPRLRFLLDVGDPDGDVAGAFLAYELRDGLLGQPQDGRNELYLPNVTGWDGPFVPDQRVALLPFGLDDVVAVRVYLMDLGGNVLTVSDSDLAHGSF